MMLAIYRDLKRCFCICVFSGRPSLALDCSSMYTIPFSAGPRCFRIDARHPQLLTSNSLPQDLSSSEEVEREKVIATAKTFAGG